MMWRRSSAKPPTTGYVKRVQGKFRTVASAHRSGSRPRTSRPMWRQKKLTLCFLWWVGDKGERTMGEEQDRNRQALLDGLQGACEHLGRCLHAIAVQSVTEHTHEGDATLRLSINDFVQARAAVRALGGDTEPSAAMSNYTHWLFLVSDSDREFHVSVFSDAPKQDRIKALRAELAVLESEVAA